MCIRSLSRVLVLRRIALMVYSTWDRMHSARVLIVRRSLPAWNIALVQWPEISRSSLVKCGRRSWEGLRRMPKYFVVSFLFFPSLSCSGKREVIGSRRRMPSLFSVIILIVVASKVAAYKAAVVSSRVSVGLPREMAFHCDGRLHLMWVGVA